MANKIGIVLALDGEREFTQGMKNAKESAKQCDQELKNLKKEYADNANSLEALTKKQEALKSSQEALKRTLDQAKNGLSHAKDQYKKCGTALEDYKKDLEKAKTALKDMEKAGDTSSQAYKDQAKAVEDLEKKVEKQSLEYSKASGNITKWETAVSKAEADVKKNSKAVDQNAKYIDEAKNSADKCATSIDKFGKEIKQTGDEAKEAGTEIGGMGDKIKTGAMLKLGALATEGVAKLGQAAVDAAKKVVEIGSEFEASMSKVEALSGATGSDLERLTDKAREMGKTTKFTASEAADAFSYMALAGWGTNEMLSGIDGVLNLAAASEMDLATASDIVTDYLSAFGMEASEAGKLADQLAYAQANSNTTTQQLADAFGNCAANMNAAGQDIETTTSFLEAFANQGIKGSEAGTKLSAIMRDITSKMKDGKIMIGDTAIEVQDANGNFRDLTDIMIDVERATTGMGDAERAAALSATFTSRSVGGLNMILNEGMENISGYESDLRNADGAASNMAQTMNKNLNGALAEANSAASNLGIEVYNHVSGPLTSAVRVATDVINGITTAITPQETALDNFMKHVKGLHEEVQGSISAADNALAQGARDISAIDAAVEVIEKANEQFGIFTKTDPSSTVSKVGKAAEDMSEPLSQIAEGGASATEGLNGISDADVSKPGSLDTAEADIESKTNEIGTDVQNAETALTGMGNTVAGTPDTATAAEDVNTNMTAIQQDLTDTAEALTGMEDIEVPGLNMEQLENDLDNANIKVYSAEAAVEFLAQKIPAIGDAWDENTKTLNMSHSEFMALIDEEKRAIMANALEIAKAEGIKAYTTALVEQKAAASALEDIFEQAATASGKPIESMEDLLALQKETTEWFDIQQNQKQSPYDGLVDSAREASASVETANNDLEDARNSMERYENAADEAAKELGFVADAENDMATSTKDAATATGEASEELLQKFEAIQAAAEKAGEGVRAEFNQIKESIMSTFDFNLGDMWDGGIDQTVEEMMAALDSQIEGMTNYAQNLEIVKDHVGQEIAPEFMAYLESLGSDGANILAHIVNTFDKQGEEGAQLVKDMSDKWVAAMDQKERIAGVLAADQIALRIGLGEFGSTAEEWEGLAGVVNALQESGEQIDPAIIAAFDEAAQTAQAAGVKIPEGLVEGIESAGTGEAEAALIAATQALNAALSGSLDELIAIAQENGVEVSSELAAAVEAGGPEAAAAAQEIINQITEKLGEAEDAATTSGETVGSEFASAAEGQADAASSAGETVASSATEGLEGQSDEFTTAGTTAGGNYVTGLESNTAGASSAGMSLASAAHQGTSGNFFSFQAAGGTAGSSYVSGINSYAPYANSAGYSLASSALSGASSVGGFSSIGYNMAAGIAGGISSGRSAVVNAIVSAVNAGIAAGRAAAGINSPSRKTRDLIGRELTNGIAQGIKDRNGYVLDIAEAQMNKILLKLSDWIKKNKNRLGNTSEELADSVGYAWQSLGRRAANNNFWVNKDDKTYKKNKQGKLTSEGAERYYQDVYRAAQQYMRNVEALYDVSDEEQVEYWRTVRDGLQRGTQAWYDAQAQIRNLKDKINEEAARTREQEQMEEAADRQRRLQTNEHFVDRQRALFNRSNKWELEYWIKARKQFEQGSEEYQTITERIQDMRELIQQEQEQADKEQLQAEREAVKAAREKILSDAEEYVRKKKALDKMSTVDEIAYWKKVLKTLKKGTKEYKAVLENIYAAKKDVGGVNVAEQLLGDYQVYYEMSEKAEMQYWDNIRRRYKLGTEDRIKADQQYYNAKKTYTEKLKQIEDDYAEKIKSANQTYKDALEQRKEELMSAYNLEDYFESSSATGKELLYNLQTQAAGYTEWNKSIAQLQKRGILSDDLMNQLIDKGPNSIATIKALLTLSNKELKEYQKAYDDKEKQALIRAKKDTADTKAEIQKEIADLKKQRTKELKELNQGISSDMAMLATNIRSIAADMTNALVGALKGNKTGAQSAAALVRNAGNKISNKPGKARGTRRVGSGGMVWMDEFLDSIGPEMIISRSDNAILTRAQASDAIIPANLADNLFKWGAIDPTQINTASMTALNQRLLEGYQASMRASTQQTARMDEILGLMAEFLPYLAEKTRVTISSREAAEAMSADMSRTMAANVRRIRR